LGINEEDNPAAGKWSTKQEEILCKGQGLWGTNEMDKDWSKEDLCRDHGNGLEVVCIENFYEKVRGELPRPDLAVMFSPGFPQLGRRTWDTVLVGLLNNNVPAMTVDLVILNSWGYKVRVPAFGARRPVAPGEKWDPSQDIGEDGQTWLTMSKYGAYRLKARRNPFPIVHPESEGFLAKNAVVQIYQSYKPNRKPTPALTDSDIAKHMALVRTIDWEHLGTHRCPSGDLKSIFSIPTSVPFDNAIRDMYIEEYQRLAQKRFESLSTKAANKLKKYGVLKDDGKIRRKHWGLKQWAYILKTLGCTSY
jgi:hypothetical protein